MGYSLLLGTVAEKKIRKKFGLVLNPPRMPFIFCPFRLAKFGQIMTIKNFVLIIFFGKFFFWCKICFSQYRCIFQQKKWGSNFFTEKRPNWGGRGGGPRGVWQKTTLFPDFFFGYLPLLKIPFFILDKLSFSQIPPTWSYSLVVHTAMLTGWLGSRIVRHHHRNKHKFKIQ